MARMVYFIKVRNPDGSSEYRQISGRDFYSLVNTDGGKKRFFEKLEGDSDGLPTILIESSEEQYRKWRTEYDGKRYSHRRKKYLEIPYGAVLEMLDKPDDGTDPQEYVIGMEVADRIRGVYRELDEKDKWIFQQRFIREPKMPIYKVAKELGMATKTVRKRQKKIQEKILKALE